MPAATPSGYLSLAYNYLRESLAASATWQAMCSVNNAAAAKAYIHIGDADAETLTRPFCILCGGKDNVRRTASDYMHHSGSAKMVLEFVPGGTPAELWACNQAGALVSEIGALSGQPGYLDASSIEIEQEPTPSEPSEGESTLYYQLVLNVTWGEES